MRDKELQEPNIVLKFPDDVTAVVVKAGISATLLQLLNMKLMFVTAAVLNNGTICKLEQPLNIPLMSVTETVLNNGTVCRLEQF
jgi:hypothetical protein